MITTPKVYEKIKVFFVFTLYLSLFLSAYWIFYELPQTWIIQNFSGKSDPLRYDSLLTLGYTASLLCISFLLKNKYIYILVFLIITIMTLSIASSWMYYDFYKDFVIIGTLLLAPDLINGGATGGLHHLASYEFVLSLFIVFIIFILSFFFLTFKKTNTKVETIGLLATFVFFALTASINQYKLYQVNYNLEFAAINLPPMDVNPASYFISSIFKKNIELEFSENHLEAIKLINPNPLNTDYPIYKQNHVTPAQTEMKKNIIVIVLESVRAAETGFFSQNPQSVTPNIDLIAKETDTFVNFYSNSVQTVRAELSILCSVLDFSKGTPLSRRGKSMPTKCLPSILNEHGYENYWFHGNDEKFFNRGRFFPSLGFNELYDKKSILKEKPHSKILGWGISDKDTFSYSFEKLLNKKEPFFAEILTLSNHFPFDFGFEESTQESTTNSTVYNNFLRGIQYTDKQLGIFWQKFKKSKLKDNTILIITSDHGLWFQENNFTDIYKANEALFRVPLMIWNPNTKPENLDVYKTIASHIDITPTILNILGINSKNTAFMGEDLYSNNRRELALITGFGGYAARNKDKFCFPASGSKQKGYFKEQRVKNPHQIICRKGAHDVLRNDYKNEGVTPLIPPPSEYQRIIEFNDISLLKGFIPKTKLE